MKKLIVFFAAVSMVMGFAMTAGAAASVQVTLTSPAVIQASASSCEKFGSVTFDFPVGSTLKAGDWWYMDLPAGVVFCKPIDYLIVGNGATGYCTWVGTSTLDPTLVYFNNISNTLGGNMGFIPIGGIGPLSVVQVGPTAMATIVSVHPRP